MKKKALRRPSGSERKVVGRKKPTPRVDNNSPQLTESMRDAFLHFIEYHPPSRVSRHLRRMLVEWVVSEGAVEALDFEDIMYDVEGLFGLLDGVGDWKSVVSDW